MTVNSRVIRTFLSWNADAVDMPLSNGQRVQILPEMEDLPRARKHQFAAFVASLGLLVVWDDEPTHLIERARMIEAELIDIVWQTGNETQESEKKGMDTAVLELDEESGEVLPQDRPTHLQNSVLVACTLVIVLVLLGLGFRAVASEVGVDKNYLRVAFLLLTPGKLSQVVTPKKPLTSIQSRFSSPSSLLKSSLAALRNVSAPFDRWPPIAGSTVR